MKLFLVLGLLCFAGSLSIRMADPVVPLIAADFGVSLYQAVTISTAFALPYALSQPLTGPIGDAWSKARLVHVCLALMVFGTLVCMLAPNFTTLFVGRVIAGIAGGGSIPMALSIVADRFAFEERQVALSRLMFAAVLGQLGGSILSGIIGEHYGWRAPFGVGAFIGVIALVACLWGLKPRPVAERPGFSFARARAGYAAVFANPKAYVCYLTVFAEGVLLYGVFPHIAALLQARGAGGAHEAGYIIASFGAGGIAYAGLVSLLLRRFTQFDLMRIGGFMITLGLLATAFATSAWAFAAAFLTSGLGFYLLHGPIQAQATELAPEARGSAVGLHAFSFFAGGALGPLAYSTGFFAIGPRPTLIVCAIAMAVVAIVSSLLLARLGRA